MSPVAAFTAVSCPHGGFWQGQFASPMRASNVERAVDTFSYGTAEPSLAGPIMPMAPTSCVATMMKPFAGSKAAPPQFAPPSVPGNRSVGFKPHGVNGPAFDTPPRDEIRTAHARE